VLCGRRLAGGAARTLLSHSNNASQRIESTCILAAGSVTTVTLRLAMSTGKRHWAVYMSALGAASSVFWVLRQKTQAMCSVERPITKVRKEQIGVAEIIANQHMEDRHVIAELPPGLIALGVFDGHGGSEVAEWLTQAMPIALGQQLELESAAAGESKGNDEVALTALRKAFCECDEQLLRNVLPVARDMKFSNLVRVGACAVCVLIDSENLYVASAGDSRAVLVRGGKCVTISKIHNADQPREQMRLRHAHPGEDDLILCRQPTGMVSRFTSRTPGCAEDLDAPCYVKGRLQPTRSFGDFYLKDKRFNFNYQEGAPFLSQPSSPPYITAEPEVDVVQRRPEDEFLLLASDGLFDYLTEQQVADVCRRCVEQDKATPTQVARSLIQEAVGLAATTHGFDLAGLMQMPAGRRRRRYHDDITVVCVRL